MLFTPQKAEQLFLKELKMTGPLLSSLEVKTTLQHNYHDNQHMVKPNEMVGFIAVIRHGTSGCHFFLVCPQHKNLPREGSLHGASSYFSAWKILVLGSSQYQGQVPLCKLNTENIWLQDDPPSMIFLVLEIFPPPC